MNQKDYWDKKIRVWSDSIYGDNPAADVPLIERIAARFRSPIKNRHKALLKYLDGHIENKQIIELGCGSGELSFELAAKGIKKVISIDIAPSAVDYNTKKATDLNAQDKLCFLCEDVRNLNELPQADIIVGLGFIDYLNLTELETLFNKIRERKFIFSLPEKKFSVINVLQYFYLRSQGCPGFYKFKPDELNAIFGQGLKYPCIDGLLFVSNF